MKRLILFVLLACLAGGGEASARRRASRTCNLVFIGNSITEGALHADKAKTAPPVFAAEYVGRMLGADVNYRNCGRSGATTVDFLPAREADFKRVEQAVGELQAISYEPIVFSIMLGTNDSASSGPLGAPVSNDDYKRNLLTIIGRLREMCPDAIFVLQRPIWYSPNTYNGAMYLVAGQKRLLGYANVLIDLVDNNDDIYLGDFKSFEYFRANYRKLCFPENGNAGVFYLHPNEEGARKLAKRWARAIVRAVEARSRGRAVADPPHRFDIRGDARGGRPPLARYDVRPRRIDVRPPKRPVECGSV